jgi:hypothetical protein
VNQKPANIHFESDRAIRGFRTGVSLHGHTLHSRETLDFIYKLAGKLPPMQFALEKGQERYHAAHGKTLDLTRAWWTPPCAPLDAWNLETKHIHDLLDMNALVSITDHDNIDAPANLRILETCREVPISLEWTVPFENTFFHLGVHNLAADRARDIFRALENYTDHPEPAKLPELLESLVENPTTLIVFNHPYWDERGIGEDPHRDAAHRFTRAHLGRIHAFELNGLRTWKENRAVFGLASMFGLPLISGGDRHALEPNTILNLTRASSFEEFVEEIRKGESHVLITEQYMEPFALRILQSIEEILSDLPNHALGWRLWSDRTFYQYDDGTIRSLGESWEDREPLAVTIFVRGFQMLRHSPVKRAFRFAFPRRNEAIL